jgi:2-oxoglutarate dehydrogenase E2 component (dihydrolipoamide succinyltransferase)
MKINIVVPDMGESVSKGVIVDWLKKTGDVVKEGEGLFELETDKATVVVPSTAAGIVEILVQKESEVTIGQTVATVDGKDTAQPPQQPNVAPAPPQPAPAAPAAALAAAPLSPAVRRIAAENNISPEAMAGTGKGGRITKADALAAARHKDASVSETLMQPATHLPQKQDTNAPQAGPQIRVRMSLIRKRTAERLVLARQQSVHVTTYNEIDMRKVMGIRSHFQEAFEKEHGIKIGYMSFFVKACCKALASHRELNARVDGDEIVYNNYYNIGVAISLDRGLIVPVVRNADALTFAGIESAIASLAKRARDKLLTPSEFADGTFTITNGGVFGSLMSTPVPAYPQSAILGMHAIKKRPVVADDAIVIRPMMYVALTYDHRIIDGRDAIGFLVKVKEFIEEPDTLLLEM